MSFKNSILLLFLFFCVFSSGQIIVKGKILNEKLRPLANANILILPVSKEGKLFFTTSKENGTYYVEVTTNSNYKLTVSYLGYINQEHKIITNDKDITLDFTLKEDLNKLKEVIINYNEPIKIKKDTTTYDVSAFTNGKERKLRQVLKKLPGVEVDRSGNVTVQGKRVTKVLVEGKTFFTGDSKLAVNNIPADVLDEIEVIDDYHETSFMKGLEESSDLAMNIKLKEGKKQFLFGDIEVGAGIKDRYTLHPALFYYSPKTTYNFIGDYNNSGDKSFSFKDYMSFENGGYNSNTFSSLYTSSIASLLREKDITANTHRFGGLNFQFNPSDKNEFSTFVIGLLDDSNTRNESLTNYITDDIDEQRISLGNQDQGMLLTKLKYKYTPDHQTVINLDTRIEVSSLDSNLLNKLSLVSQDYQFSTKNDIYEFNLKANLKVEKQFSKSHTSTLNANYGLFKKNGIKDWTSDINIFPSSLTIEDDSFYTILKDSENKLNQLDLIFKHYWILNRKNHVYARVGYQLSWDLWEARDYQLLSNNTSNQFTDFINDMDNSKTISFLDVEYKYLLGSAFMTFKLGYENYFRSTNQIQARNTRSRTILRPEFNFKYDINKRTELNLSYRLSTLFPNSNQLALGRNLKGFNSIYLGNINLLESYYHSINLSYRKFNTYSISFYPSIGYRLRERTVNNVFETDGIYSSFTPVNINTPSEEFYGNLRMIYNKPYWKISLTSHFSNYDYATIVDTIEIGNINSSLSGDLSFRTKFEENPNIDFSLRQSINNNRSGTFDSKTLTTNLDIASDYQLNDWLLKGEYLYTSYENDFSNSRNKFNEINASIFYQKEDSVWGFELRGTNIGNNLSKLSTSLSSVLFNETRTYVFPRTIMFKIIYKL